MKVNGKSIIITDPCYISKKDDWGKGFDYCEHKIDPSLGFSDYLMENTGGDGVWSVYEINRKESLRGIENLLRNIYEEEDYEYKLKGTEIGSFSADAGMSCVLFLDEVEKYGPKDDLDSLLDGCAVIIEDFTGDVTVFFDESGQFHFIGIGNKSFYTV